MGKSLRCGTNTNIYYKPDGTILQLKDMRYCVCVFDWGGEDLSVGRHIVVTGLQDRAGRYRWRANGTQSFSGQDEQGPVSCHHRAASLFSIITHFLIQTVCVSPRHTSCIFSCYKERKTNNQPWDEEVATGQLSCENICFLNNYRELQIKL